MPSRTWLTVTQAEWDQEKFETLLAEWLVACDQPFDSVEKPEFRDLLQYVHRRNLKIPKRTTVRCRIMDMGAKAVADTAKMFSVSFDFKFSFYRCP